MTEQIPCPFPPKRTGMLIQLQLRTAHRFNCKHISCQHLKIFDISGLNMISDSWNKTCKETRHFKCNREMIEHVHYSVRAHHLQSTPAAIFFSKLVQDNVRNADYRSPIPMTSHMSCINSCRESVLTLSICCCSNRQKANQPRIFRR